METKNEGNVSIMKDEIIKASIESLKTEGLKFSVDMLAEKLKISKKTIYKYFSSKEALARAIYESYYNNAEYEIGKILSQADYKIEKLLWIYYDSQAMTDHGIFNKYNLNDVIRKYAFARHFHIWEKISECIGSGKTESELDALEIIVDGTLKELTGSRVKPELVIEKLVKILC